MDTQHINDYLTTVHKRFSTGNASEHTYRGDLETLLRGLLPSIEVTNEPSKVTDCGNPDYLLSEKNIPVGFIEAKDIGKDLNSKLYKEQFTRYRNALDNLIITDYLLFQFFKNGELVEEIRIADIAQNTVAPRPENFARFAALMNDFVAFIGQTITSPTKLAEMMAGKARLLENTLENALNADLKNGEITELYGQYKAFQDILIHDLTPASFADIYAQTLAYGMFAARLHDDTLDTFSRQEAAQRIPKSNPFLRRLFDYVSGANIDERIEMTVDNLADVFRATDVAKLLSNFGRSKQDPIIHFYETFLSEYNPKLRKQRGVWYTPEPVVNFIVRAVDDVLKNDFGLSDGLANTEKTTIKVKQQGTATKSGKDIFKDESVHKVQILDPATGTGTFLSAIIRHVYDTRFAAMGGMWQSYVTEHLIPRINGFELLMAPYAMAHLKLNLLLKETGYKNDSDQRLNVFLTNSLEEHHPDTGTLFAGWLSQEANAANRIKRDSPVMVVLGNPPYSGESANKGDWIMQLMNDYKKEPGGIDKLKERNPKVINDDYVKFMRYGQHFIEKNGEGILAFINPHGFIDNPTYRGMRWQLLNTYDSIYIIDLHGNSKKKETCPNGSKDDNVFDIQQGVSINILVKTGKKKKGTLGKMYHVDCYGKRQEKYDWLDKHHLADIDFTEIPHNEPMHFMVPKNFALESKYKRGFSIDELLTISSSGVKTHRDDFVINIDKENLKKQMSDFFEWDREKILKEIPVKETVGWKINDAKDKAHSLNENLIKSISYRPFDLRHIYFEENFIDRARTDVMMSFIAGENYGFISARSNKSPTCDHFFITENIPETKLGERTTQSALFPLFLYTRNLDGSMKRISNLNINLVQQFADNVGVAFIDNPDGNIANSSDKTTFTPVDLLDYIYAILHSPSYREKYAEFLKIDFPRAPFTNDTEHFWQLVELGGQLRQWHLLKHADVADMSKLITSYPVGGDNAVTRKMTKTSIGYEIADEATGKVWINNEQYFDNVPKIAWEFYIGGYQPAQKWLKDRVGRTLSFEDILHYQRVILSLSKTHELMLAIDDLLIL